MTTQQNQPHPLNRHVVIGDNLEMLTALDDETADLIVTDPPFAKNYDFTGNLKPPLSPEELALEKQTLADWGITSRAEAEAAGLEWPLDNGASAAGFSDIWKWEEDVREEWLDKIEEQYQAAAKVIEAARYVHSEGARRLSVLHGRPPHRDAPGAETDRFAVPALRRHRQLLSASPFGRGIRRRKLSQRNHLVVPDGRGFQNPVFQQTRHHFLLFQNRALDIQQAQREILYEVQVA